MHSFLFPFFLTTDFPSFQFRIVVFQATFSSVFSMLNLNRKINLSPMQSEPSRFTCTRTHAYTWTRAASFEFRLVRENRFWYDNMQTQRVKVTEWGFGRKKAHRNQITARSQTSQIKLAPTPLSIGRQLVFFCEHNPNTDKSPTVHSNGNEISSINSLQSNWFTDFRTHMCILL